MKPVRILVFAKAPVAGQVKTRLIPALGASEAARLARDMLDRTLNAALAARIGTVELCASPAIDSPAWAGFVVDARIEASEQGEGDLGHRMRRAAQRSLARGETPILVGTDCVEMAPDLLAEAAARLAAHDLVLYPTSDGGYALLGLAGFDPQLFENIAWSTGSVAETTLARARTLGLRIWTGRLLHDLDEPQDLARYPDALRSYSGYFAGCACKGGS